MERLVEVVQRRARERAQRFVGRTLDVLVEGTSRTDASRLRGRTRHNKVVNFDGLAAAGRDRAGRRSPPRRRQTLARRDVAARPRRGLRLRIRPPRMRTYVRCAGNRRSAAADRQARLPGYAEAVDADVRRPEALDIRFHEVHAKSALNRVPGSSRVPFSWTVNPYRGCTHACATASPVRRTSTSTSTPGGTSSGRSSSRSTCPEVLRAELARPSWTRRARRARHEHRPVPVGRGPLQAHARHLGGDA